MYQDNREYPCDIPPCDCKPDVNYPENPDWLWFFTKFQEIINNLDKQTIDKLVEDVAMLQSDTEGLIQVQTDYVRKDRQLPFNEGKEHLPVEINRDNGQLFAALPGQFPKPYVLPQATSTTLGGVKADPAAENQTIPVGIQDDGKLVVAPSGGGSYVLPQATPTTLGGVKADPAAENQTIPVGIQDDGKLVVAPSGGGSYVLPQATSTTLGGVKADPALPGQTTPVGLDADGKMVVFPAGEGSQEVQVTDTPPTLPSVLLYVNPNEDAPTISVDGVDIGPNGNVALGSIRKMTQLVYGIQHNIYPDRNGVFDMVKWNLETNHPVGSWWFSDDPQNPRDLFGGGDWVRLSGHRGLIAADDDAGPYGAGKTGGEEKHLLTSGEMPKHNHGVRATGGSESEGWDHFQKKWGASWGRFDGLTYDAGGSLAHNNMPPYYATYIWRRTA